MRLDKKDFFHQATIRICGDLNIEIALQRCIKYLKEVIPVSGMSLHLLDHTLNTVKTIAHISLSSDSPKFDKTITLPEEAKEIILSRWIKIQTHDVVVFNKPETDPVTKTMSHLVKNPNSSVMVMRLRMEDNRLGLLAMYVEKKDQYTTEHTTLLSLLHDPFAIAMSNALKHEEVLNLKDMLVDDVQYLHRELLRISGDELVGKDGGLKGVMEMVRQGAGTIPLDLPPAP